MAEKVVLVAFTVDADNPERILSLYLDPRDHRVTSWWIAEDDRHDGSDNDSAVFVHKGEQRRAYELLHSHGLTGEWNLRREEQ